MAPRTQVAAQIFRRPRESLYDRRMRIAPFVGLGLVLAAGGAMAESPPITHVQHYSSAGSGTYTANTTAENTTAAVRFDMGDGSEIYYIEFWFGPSGTERDVTLTIWDDTAGTLEPGTMLSQETITITPDTAVQSRSVFTSSLTQKIRVGITSPDVGPPSIGLDLDGISAPDLNFIKVGDGAWQTAADASLTGDWVIAINHNGDGIGPNPTTPDAPDDGGDDPSDDQSDDQNDGDDPIDDNPATDDGGLDDETGCCSSSTGVGGGALLGLLVLGMLLAPRRR